MVLGIEPRGILPLSYILSPILFFILKQDLSKLQRASLSSWGWLQTRILRSLPPKYWDYKRVPPRPTYSLFWNRVSLSCWGWLWTCDPPISASQVLGLQVCATTPGSLIFILKQGLAKLLRLASDLQSSFLSLPSIRIIGVRHHAQPQLC